MVVLVGLAAWTIFSPFIVSWLARGQSTEDLAQLTGRTKVWAAIAARQTTMLQEFFGTGLGNKSFDGLAIDSNWVATHLELGRVGVALVVAILLVIFLGGMDAARPARAAPSPSSSSSTAWWRRSPRRAWATPRRTCSTSRSRRRWSPFRPGSCAGSRARVPGRAPSPARSDGIAAPISTLS